MEVDCQPREILAGCRSLSSTSCRLRGQISNIDQIPIHLPSDLSLLFRCTGDHQITLTDLTDCLRDFGERLARRLGQL